MTAMTAEEIVKKAIVDLHVSLDKATSSGSSPTEVLQLFIDRIGEVVDEWQTRMEDLENEEYEEDDDDDWEDEDEDEYEDDDE